MIYLDYAATSPIDTEVFKAMQPYLTEHFGNPSSLYSIGKEARKAVETAREQVANAINAEPEQIAFTSGASESNNWVCSIFDRVLCSPYEHHSILNRPNTIEMRTFAPIASDIYRWSPNLVSYMWVNNEIGTIYDIKEVAKISHNMGVPFHTDGTQAFSHLNIDVKEIDCDFLSLSGHKFKASKGIGVLYIKEPDKFKPLIYGGRQEHNIRAGTENVAAIVGIGKAAELFHIPHNTFRCIEIQNQFVKAFSDIKDVHFNTDIDNSISTTLNVAFKGVESEVLMLLLDRDGICVSSGSACNSGSLEPSHVLKAIGCPEEYIYNSIRLSWDETLSDADIEYTIECIKKNVEKVRGYI